MIRKYATATIIHAEVAQPNALGLIKASHRATFDYEPRPGFLYVRSRMISSRCNDNHDEFPAEEIRQGWKTFIGKPVFVNHHNEDHRRMRGVIIDAALHEDTLPGGQPDVWVEGLHEVDALRFPKLAQAILSGRVNRTSMGTDVEYSICSACNNRARTPAEYCQHIPKMKGKILYRHTASGQREGHLIREKCYGLRFFENSFLVEDPADPTAIITGIDSSQVSPDFSSRHTSYMVRGNTEDFSDHAVSKQPFASHDSNFSDHGVGQRGMRVFPSSGTSSLGDHVGRIVGVGAQTPVQRLHAQDEVAGMKHDQSRRDGSYDVGVAPAMGSHAASRLIREGEAGVPVLEDAARPGPAGRRTRTSVNLGEVPLHLRHGAEETTIGRVAHVHGGDHTPADHPDVVTGIKAAAAKTADRQLSLFPEPQRVPRRRPSKTADWSSDDAAPLSWNQIGQRHPALYGDPEVHGEEAKGADGEGIGWAANHLAHATPEDPDAEESHVDFMDFRKEIVDPRHIDYARHGSSDSRVRHAYEGYRSNPNKVPPVVLVHRHGVYQVADGHHRAEAAARAGQRVRAYVAYSPFPDTPSDDGEKAPYHGAEKTRGNPFKTASRDDEPIYCDQGHKHDSPYGGAGMLIRHMGDDGQDRYLLQKRAPGIDEPDTWAFPGGGLHEGEEPAQGAWRETSEEMGALPEGIKPTGLHTDDHGGWAFHTLQADAPHRFEPSGSDGESAGHGWFTVDEMNDLPLHPGFKKNLKAVTSMRKQAETHPDAACPSCGSDDFNQIGNIGACQNCGETFDASRSMEENMVARQFAEMKRKEFTKGRQEQGELFKNVTDHPTEDVLGGHYDTDAPQRAMHQRQNQERIRRYPLGDYPRTPEQTQQQQERTLQRSKPYQLPAGPIDVRHLSHLMAFYELKTEAGRPQYEDPAEHPFFKANPIKAEHIVKSFMQADEGQRAQGMRWYSDAHLLAGAIAKGDHAKGAGVLAAYSPKASWPDNIFNAARSLHEGRALGKGEGASIMGQHQRTAQKIIDGEHHSTAMKSPKIGDFAHLIEHGDDSPEEKEQGKSRVVIDRHALSVAIGRRVTQKDLDDAPLGSRHYYEHVADAYRSAARQLSDKLKTPIAPHQVQAVTWGVQQRANEKADAEAAEAHAKGRATRTNNSWKRWEEHGKEHYPQLHDEPPNLHRRREGKTAESKEPDQFRQVTHCLNCGTTFGHTLDSMRYKKSPLCWNCARGSTHPWGNSGEIPQALVVNEPDVGGRDYTDALVRRVNENKARHFTRDDAPKQSLSSRTASKLGYGETKAPQEVDTLRTESCPVCGEQDSFDGDRCQVCNFIQPPAMFQDPDTGVAHQMDLEKVPFDQGMVGPNGEPVQGPPGDPTALEGQPLEGVPGQPGDEIADLFCPACGFSADTQEPMTDNDPSMPAQEGGLTEGDLCPNCGQATMLSGNDVGEMGGEVPQEIADDANADGVPDEEEPGVEEELDEQAQESSLPGQEGPADEGQAEGPAEEADEASAPLDKDTDDEQTGVEDEDSGREGPEDSGEEPEEDEDQGPVKNRKKAKKGWSTIPGPSSRETMTQPNQAATAESRKLAAMEQTIKAQAAMLEVAGQQLHYLAQLAGVGKEFEAMKRQGAKKIADIMNPAEPVPDPPSAGPSESTDQAATPETYDDPRRPGLTPGSTNGVPAQMTDSPLQPGATVPTQPFTNLVDVSAPVAGTETHVPLEQTKIETDVRVGDPMTNADNPQGYGFPLTGPFAQEGAASVGTTTSPGAPVGGDSGRTMASLRLAELRKSAGLITADKFVEGTKIETNPALSMDMINHEIQLLSSLQKASGAPRRSGSVPKQASAERGAPSLVGAPERTAMLSTTASLDADDAFDLFLD